MAGNYDRIAEIYDVDMGGNMAFDDVGFYAALCEARGGTVLELGCGNGRILLELVARGCDAVGVDASAGMLAALQVKARQRGMAAPRVCRMDVRALAFRPVFSTVLCPYSLVTYLTSDAELRQLCDGARGALRPGGELIVDAFVPRTVASAPEFTLDYRRPYGDGEIARHKRITRLGPALNRIERRYERYNVRGERVDAFEVSEIIRPCTPETLRTTLAAYGFAVQREWWDYRDDAAANAQFFTVAARPR